jgi:outer membrane biosynthesis protein TonB
VPPGAREINESLKARLISASGGSIYRVVSTFGCTRKFAGGRGTPFFRLYYSVNKVLQRYDLRFTQSETAMWVKGVGTVAIVLFGLFASVNVKAQTSTTPYVVNGLELGARLAPNSGAYRGYNCTPSSAFAGLTWCSRSVAEKGSYGQKNASNSLLRTADGTIVYANRATDLTSFRQDAAKKELQRLAQRYGAPRIIDMPHKPKSQQGMIASWGDVVLEPLDAASMSQLALGKSPNKGLIIDFLGNFRRSAQLGLPVYRMTGGAGFVWATSFNQKGAGTLRFAAVNPSALSAPVSAPPLVAAEPTAQPTETQAQAQPPVQAQPEVRPQAQAEPQPQAQPQPQVQSQAPPAQPQPQMQAQAPAQPQSQIQPQATAPEPTPPAPVAREAEPDTKIAELNQTIDKLKSQLASYATDVIQLEKEKGEAQQALPQLHQALNDADTARQQAQAATLALKGQLDAAIRRSNNLAYAMLAGLVVVLLSYGAVFAGKWRQAWLARREPAQKIVKVLPHAAPAAVNAAGLLSELEQHVANINAVPTVAPAVVPDQAPETAPEDTRAETPAAS